MDDTTKILIIGGLALYYLSPSIKNVSNTVNTVSDAVNNTTKGVNLFTGISLMPLTGKNPLTPNVPSIYSGAYWSHLWEDIKGAW